MSCGRHHDVDCDEVLNRVYLFLDHEMEGSLTYAQIEQHLIECGPCLSKFDIERVVRTLVQRSCAEHAPEALRAKVRSRIHELTIEITEV